MKFGEELAHSAYYRHLHDKTGIVCPGKEGHLLDRDNASVISSESSVMSFTSTRLDSTFDFGSNSDCDSRESDCDIEESDLLDEVAPDEMSSNSVEFSFYESSSEGEELWEFSESDEENAINNFTPTVDSENMLLGISFSYPFFASFTEFRREG